MHRHITIASKLCLHTGAGIDVKERHSTAQCPKRKKSAQQSRRRRHSPHLPTPTFNCYLFLLTFTKKLLSTATPLTATKTLCSTGYPLNYIPQSPPPQPKRTIFRSANITLLEDHFIFHFHDVETCRAARGRVAFRISLAPISQHCMVYSTLASLF